MVTDNEKTKDTVEDPIEALLVKVRKNAGAFEMLLDMADKLERGGLSGIIEKIAGGALPSDLEYLFEFITSEPMRESMIKGGNIMLLLIHAISDEKVADAIKALASNLNHITDMAGSFADDAGKSSVLKLYSAMKDPDISYAIMSMMGALKAAGQILRELRKDQEMQGLP